MVQLFTHRKRSYVGCDRNRMDFKITVDHINFTMNKYFLANSHYVIFRKENKSKQFVSESRVLTAAELTHVPVNEKIKFRSCLMQDLAHRYLEKYISKTKRFLVRQVTAVTNEELYVNVGYFELQLDIYAMLPSGQDVVVNFVDPGGMAAGTVTLKVEHEPRIHMNNYIPNFRKSIMKYFPKTHTKEKVATHTRLDNNRQLLDFVKQQKLAHHHSLRYDGSSDDEYETSSESGNSDHSASHDEAAHVDMTKSFVMNRTGMPQMGASNKNHHHSIYLGPNMFTFEDNGSDTPTQSNMARASSFQEEESVPTLSVTRQVSFGVVDIPFIDTMSTLSGTPRTDSNEESVSPHNRPSSRHHKVTLPSTPLSSHSRGAEALERNSEKDVVLTTAIVEQWEDPADFDKLPPTSPRSRSGSVTLDTTMGRTVPVAPPTPTPTPKPVSPRIHALPRSTSDSSSMAQMLLSMQSEDECDLPRAPVPVPVDPYEVSCAAPKHKHLEPLRVTEPSRAAPQTHVERHVEKPAAVNVNTVRSASPAVRHLVPVRLTQQQSATIEQTERSAEVASSSMSGRELEHTTTSPRSTAHVHKHHRAASTGDMYSDYGGSGHHRDHHLVVPSVSVKELRLNYERPPLVKANSGGSDSSDPHKLSPKNLTRTSAARAPVPALNLQKTLHRASSERSCSTLSTHDNLPQKNHQSTPPPPLSRILVPVRMQSSAQEQAYHTDRYSHQERDVQYHHRENHVAPARTLDFAQDSNMVRSQSHSHGDRPRHSESQHQDAHGFHHSQSFGGPAHPHHHRSHHGIVSPLRDEESPALHRAHSMAPPIRLTTNDYLPPTYERYVEVPHHHHSHHEQQQPPRQHQHQHPGSSGPRQHQHHHQHYSASPSASSSPRDGYYSNAPVSRPGQERVYRDVYA